MKKSGSILLAGLLLTFAAPALSAPPDPVPIPDEVIQKVVREPLAARRISAVDTLGRHLDEAAGLVKRIDRGEGGEALLPGKIHEIKTAREEVRREIEKIRSGLVSAGAAEKTGSLDQLSAKVDERFDRVIGVLEAAQRGRTKAERVKALAKARSEIRILHQKPKENRIHPPLDPVPTFTREAPRWQAPEPDNAPAPRYMGYRPPSNAYAFAGQTLLAAVPPPTPTEASACGYVPADLAEGQEVQLTPEIKALAESLGYSPVRIFQYVSNEIAFEPYYGSLKGAMGTLVSKAGNATDQASLLIALLRASNVPARYVKGKAKFVEDPRLLRWVGAKDQYAAAVILYFGKIPTSYSLSGADRVVEFTHVWVEACVPYANYRGAAVDQSGHRWIPLDPSFKDKTYQAGIAVSVDFDYASYMAARTNTLPHEKYEEQVEAYVKTQPPAYGNNTLGDVPFKGTALPRKVDILPASLPYEVSAFNAWDTGLTAETAEVPDKHRYKYNITVKNGGGTFLAPTLTLSMPEVVLKRVTLSFKGATSGDQATLDSWVGNPDLSAALPCSVNVVPVIKVEGADQAVGTTAVGICTTNNKLAMELTLSDLGSPQINKIEYSNIGAANYHALQAYAFQTSDRLLEERAAKLLASVKGTTNPNANLEETQGEFLHLVGLKYMRYISDAFKRIGGLAGESGESGNHLGLTSSQMKVKYVFDLPFAVSRAGFLVDVPGGRSASVDLSTGKGAWKTFLLAGYASSAYESYIWQENARMDAVSTVRGIQYAKEKGIEVLTITSANWSAESPKLTSNADASLNYPSGAVSTLQTAVNNGYTVTAPRSLIQYNNWKGAVWVQEKNDTVNGTMSAGYMISGGYAGGYTLGTPVPVGTYNPGTNTGYYTASPTWEEIGDAIIALAFEEGIDTGFGLLTTLASDPVNMVSGNMYHTERDITIKGRGLPLVFERSYNSGSPQDGPLGFGWTHSFNHQLQFKDDNADGAADGGDSDGITSSVYWIDGTGSRKIIRVSGDGSGVPVGAAFTAPKGFYFQTSRNPDGTYTVREKNGLTYTFENVAGTVGQKAKLLKIADRSGNVLSLGYSGGNLASVTDGLARSLAFTYDGSNRIAQVCDWTGRCHQYVYDGGGNLITYKNPLAVAGTQPPVTYAYYTATDGPNLDHAMKSYTLPRGNGMTFEYYTNGRAFRHRNTLGETATFTYNDFRRESVTVNERGHTRRFFFDQYANPVKIVEENGGERTYAYDTANPHNRLSKRDPMGYVTQYAYDANGNVTKITNPSGSTVEFSHFTSFNQPGKVKDARGNYTLLKYDADGNLLQEIRLAAGIGAAVDPATYVPAPSEIVSWTIHTYGANGNILTSKRVRDFAAQAGPTVEYAYDAQGLNIVGVTRRGDKDGDSVIAPTEYDTAALSYDSLGRVTQGIRPDWYATQLQYDAVDRVVKGSDALGNLRDFEFDQNGNLSRQSLTVSGQLVDESKAAYDLSDRRTSGTDAGGSVTAYAYDPSGNVKKITSPDGYSVALEYDEMGRAVKASDEEGNTVTRDLDLDGKPRKVTDPNGNSVAYEYYGPEKDGRLKSVADALGRKTAFDYDEAGNVVSVTDNLGRTTITQYDELNRPVRIVGPAYTDVTYGTIRPVTRYTYSSLGPLVKVEAGRTDSTGTNPASDVVTTQMTAQHDDFGRKIKETDALGKSWSFVYDQYGNVTQGTDAKGQTAQYTWGYGHQLSSRIAGGQTTTWTRNSLGQVTQAVSPEVAYTYAYDPSHRVKTALDSRGNKTLTYAWTPGGRLEGIEDSDGSRTDYYYDPVGRLTGIWAPNGDLVSFFYDQGGRLTERWLDTGAHTRWAWNPDNTLNQLVNVLPTGAVLTQHAYTYDGVGNRQTHTETIAGTTTPYKYLYDELSRLTEVRNNGTDALIEANTYDPLNNRTSKTDGINAVYYLYDAANQLKEVRQGSPTGTLTAGLVYDQNGSMTKKCEGGTVTTSPADCTGSTVTSLTYDALNRLTQAAKTGISTQTYGYDDQDRRIRKITGAAATNYLYAGPDVYAEYTTWTSPTALYTHGPGMDDPILRQAGATAQYYHQDGLGSVVAISDQSGATLGTQRFDAWGKVLAQTGAIPQYGYTGREPDETGLVYYRARYYDPSVGRFVSRDPIGLGGGINAYAYVANNPTNLTDPLGLKAMDPQTAQFVQANLSYVNNSTPGMSAGNQSLAFNYQADTATDVPFTIAPVKADLPWKPAVDWAIGFLEDRAVSQLQAGNNLAAFIDALGVAGLKAFVPTTTEDLGPMILGPVGRIPGRAGQIERAAETGKRTFSAGDKAAGLEKARDATGTPRCQYCGTELNTKPGRPNSYEADHTLPYSRGGPSTPENLTPSCRTCNRSKGAQTPEEWGGP